MTFIFNNIFMLILAGFYFIGAAVNYIAPKAIREDYARWGYPEWFHYLTSGIELAVAVLLLFPEVRILGVVLGVAVMTAAALTLLFHKEFKHMITAIFILVLTGMCGFQALQ